MEKAGPSILLKMTSVLVILLSLVLIVIGAVRGQVELYLLLFLPVLRMEGLLPILGIFLLICGIVVLFLGITLKRSDGYGPEDDDRHGKSEWGGVVFLGPIPIVFGSREARKRSPSWWKLLILGIVAVAFFYLITLILASMLA